MKPSRASRPSRKEYAGSRAALRRMTDRLLVERTPVTECGYMNSASAEPRASEEYAHCATPGGMVPLPAAVPAAIPLALSALNLENELDTVENTWSQPPIWCGM